MGKLVLVAALVTGLSLGAGATSIDFDTGTFQSGTFSGTFQSTINVSVTGTLHIIDIQTGTLIQTVVGCPPGATCFNFIGGNVTVDGTLFKDAINGGITIKEDGAASISATLMAEPGVGGGTASASFTFDDGMVVSGSEDVAYNTSVPEPSALLLLGAGMVPLALVSVGRGKHRSYRSRAKDVS